MYFLIFKNEIYYYHSTKLELIEMIFFIATIFIAQIIIVWNIVFYLVALDNRINLLTLRFESYSEDLPEMMSTIREMTSDVSKMLPLIKEKLVKHRNRFIIKELKNVAESIALIAFKPQYRKLLVGAKIGLKLTKKLIKAKNMV